MVDFDKVGLLAMRGDRMLLCRKSRDTSLLILPGGCLEQGESAEECLRREVAEELGDVQVRNVRYVGTYRDVAAGHETKIVQVRLYSGELAGEPVPQSEIADLVWFGPSDDRNELSPSLKNKILPDLIARRILEWS
jgi:8-oxo-dGTP pyrophosphatase MutT (NUDIX family)